MNFQVDPNVNGWNSNGSQSSDSNIQFYIYPNQQSNMQGSPLFISTIKDALTSTGLYFNLSYNYSNNNILMEFSNNTGTLLYSNTKAYTFTYKKSPLAIYQDNNITLGLYNGIYFNSNGYVPYSTYSTYFT